jgi:hypothetical protein
MERRSRKGKRRRERRWKGGHYRTRVAMKKENELARGQDYVEEGPEKEEKGRGQKFKKLEKNETA